VRVLVVEDEENIRAVVAETLVDEGYEVEQAAHGADALALLAGGRPPDLILLDLLMPVMDGWAFAAAYRQLPPPHAPLVLFTASSLGPEGTSAGRPLPESAATLAKPFDLDELLALIGPYAGGE
jgi:CheY-like chemotaxis protein